MIVKNEADVISRCLSSVRPYINAWAIVDTGSTDGTQDCIRELMAGIPGELIERPWVDFATNRNQALDLSKTFANYALVIDADEILEVDEAAWDLTAAAYYVRQTLDGTDFEYWSAKILRLDAGWQYQGVVHEYPCLSPQPIVEKLPGVRVRSYPDGARSKRPQRDKYLDDARVLEQALAKDPTDTRYTFYLAQSLRDAGESERALEAYRKRAAMGGWAEEVWYAKFQVGVLLERLQAPAEQVIDAYLQAFDERPTRAEPLCELARYLRLKGRFGSAYIHAKMAWDIPLPDDLLFIDKSVYEAIGG